MGSARVRHDPPHLWSSPVGRDPQRLIELRAADSVVWAAVATS
jgi:hypothetical protein